MKIPKNKLKTLIKNVDYIKCKNTCILSLHNETCRKLAFNHEVYRKPFKIIKKNLKF